jgi:Homeodomain-like domain
MARPFNVEISQSTEYLSKSLKKARTAFEKERLLLLWWLKTRQVSQHQELSQRLGRDGSTVTRWLQRYRQGGLEKLRLGKNFPRSDRNDESNKRALLLFFIQDSSFQICSFQVCPIQVCLVQMGLTQICLT